MLNSEYIKSKISTQSYLLSSLYGRIKQKLIKMVIVRVRCGMAQVREIGIEARL